MGVYVHKVRCVDWTMLSRYATRGARSCRVMYLLPWHIPATRTCMASPSTPALASSLPRERQTCTMYSTCTHSARRFISSLSSLLDEKDDAYLSAVQNLSLGEIASTIQRGPSSCARLGDGATPSHDGARCEEQPPAATHMSTRCENEEDGATSESAARTAEGVLQSLRASAQKQRDTVRTAARTRRQQWCKAYTAMMPEERRSWVSAQRVKHSYEGLCALNAVLTVRVNDTLEQMHGDASASAGVADAADGSVTESECHEVMGALRAMVQQRADGVIDEETWKRDFVPEIRQLVQLLPRVSRRECDLSFLE